MENQTNSKRHRVLWGIVGAISFQAVMILLSLSPLKPMALLIDHPVLWVLDVLTDSSDEYFLLVVVSIIGYNSAIGCCIALLLESVVSQRNRRLR